ncbi:TPA: antirestriction protein ArdA [Streptococcus suis]|jgi:antirestriction protein|nr:antirestriction protein ArdA [Enterococcus faecalis]
MDDMQVYIANLGKYNEGELVGAWFTFPIDFEEVKEKISLNDAYEEYAIHDSELPFAVDEYTSIGELNRLWELVSELPEEFQSELAALLTHFSSIEELSEHQEDIILHSDCEDMEDVARYYIEGTGALGEVPASLQNYIDYQAYGRDLEIEGTFIASNHGMFEILY